MSVPVLTPEQHAIVDADLHGPRLVDAGAGTGKTFTLVQRALALIRSGALRADELLVVTFTKAAATEIAGRLEGELDPDAYGRPTCGTFHGVAGDLLREFAYEAGISPDLRIIDDARARGVFARAFGDLLAGRLDVDLAVFPLLDRPKALERSLAAMILRCKHQGEDIPAAMQRARNAAAELESIAYGAVREIKKNGEPKAGWPKPDPERSRDERCIEAARERANVDVVAALFAHFQALLDAEHLMTFGDVVIRATHMLREHPRIALALRARWKHAIVDEFQDTNDTQIALLEAIFGADLAPVLVVGDVRQAIYEFTGAQPQGIVDFRLRAREKLPLTVNRRSFQPILDLAHSTLTALGGMDPDLNPQLNAQRGDADPTCVRLRLFAGEKALEREAAIVADTLRTLIDEGASPRQCAVLVRTRTRAGIFAQAIRDRGLAVQLYGGVGFFDAAEIRDVVAWLRLADNPTDAFAVTGALQSAAIGVSDGGVALLAAGGALARTALLDPLPAELSAAECERLERFRRTARIVCALTDEPLVEAVRTVVLASGAEIARADAGATLHQVRANLEKLVRFAADFSADRPLARIRDLVNELRERDELELDLPIAEVEGDRIAMMTIHGAKGLEWDNVFLVDVGASFPLVNNDARDKVGQFDPKSGALALKHAVDGRPTLRWFLTENAHDDGGIISREPTTTSAEEFRLLYVALTRAKNALYVTGRRTKTNSISKCFKAVESWACGVSGSAERHHFGPVDPGDEYVPALPPLPVLERDVERKLFARAHRATVAFDEPGERRGPLSYTAMDLYARCPRRARYHYVFGLPDLADETPIAHTADDTNGRDTWDPARYGRVVHRALELLAQARITRIGVQPDDALADAFAQEEWTPPAGERVRARTAVDHAIASLAILQPVAAERAFDLTIDGVRLGGFIDLIAHDARGTPTIVDYKTGRTAAEHYALQFALYRYALRDEFPSAATTVLRIDDDGASFESMVPATEEVLRLAIASSKTMASDDARPGPQCSYCPYAFDVCSAAPRNGALS